METCFFHIGWQRDKRHLTAYWQSSLFAGHIEQRSHIINTPWLPVPATLRHHRAVDKPPYFINAVRYSKKIFQRKKAWFSMPWPLSFSLDLMSLTIRGIAVQLPLTLFYIGISNYVLLFALQSCLHSISAATAEPWYVFLYHPFYDSFLRFLL